MIKDAEAHADEAHKLRELADARNNAERLAYQTEKSLKEHREKLDESRRLDGRGADHGAARRARVERRRRDHGEDATRCRRPGRRLPQALYAQASRVAARRPAPTAAPRPPTTRSSRTPTTRSSTREVARPTRQRRATSSGTDVVDEPVEPEPLDELAEAAQGARRVPRRAPAAEGRVRQLPQAGGARPAGAGRARPRAARQGARCPMLDDLERALEAAVEHEEAKLEEGVRLVHRAARRRARAGGARARSRPTGSSTRTRRRRCSRSPPTRRRAT